ncbi:MAG: DUF2252 domain-containing protein [Bacteroidetes bacterium]|nr:DUF2252 domain-containing protein [Bacteroidota bacterium]
MEKVKSPDVSKLAEQDEMLFGRKGVISQSLEDYNKNLTEEEKEEKYCKMAISPFSFYRGTNHIFWKDFEWDWRMMHFGNYRTRTWLNGDCHAYNFGAYKNRKVGVIYGLNDFDESIISDYQYDLWRLAISLVLIPNETSLLKKGFPKIKLKKVIDALCSAYLETLFSFARNRKAAKKVFTEKNTTDPLRKFLKKIQKKESRAEMIHEWTIETDGKTKFNRENHDVGNLPESVHKKIEKAIPQYVKTIKNDVNFPENYFNVIDIVARKNAGTGSLGCNRYYVLIEGDKLTRDDDIILDVKEERLPSGAPYSTKEQIKFFMKMFPNEGVRFTDAYRALDYEPDEHLGWLKIEDKYYSVRERNPFKKAFKTNKDIKEADDYENMAKAWGTILATEHSRAERVSHHSLGNEVKRLTNGKIKEFQELVYSIAVGYAKVVNSDYALFVKYIAPKKADCAKFEEK